LGNQAEKAGTSLLTVKPAQMIDTAGTDCVRPPKSPEPGEFFCGLARNHAPFCSGKASYFVYYTGGIGKYVKMAPVNLYDFFRKSNHLPAKTADIGLFSRAFLISLLGNACIDHRNLVQIGPFEV
jgi:hypothetical protein